MGDALTGPGSSQVEPASGLDASHSIPIAPAALMAAVWWGERLQRGDKEAFVKWLAMIVTSELALNGKCYLECDYDPDKHLISALAAAGVECRGFLFSASGILPTKHELSVFPDRLEPKEGYGNWTACIPVAAQAIEAGTAETGTGSVNESAVPKGNAP